MKGNRIGKTAKIPVNEGLKSKENLRIRHEHQYPKQGGKLARREPSIVTRSPDFRGFHDGRQQARQVTGLDLRAKLKTRWFPNDFLPIRQLAALCGHSSDLASRFEGVQAGCTAQIRKPKCIAGKKLSW